MTFHYYTIFDNVSSSCAVLAIGAVSPEPEAQSNVGRTAFPVIEMPCCQLSCQASATFGAL